MKRALVLALSAACLSGCNRPAEPNAIAVDSSSTTPAPAFPASPAPQPAAASAIFDRDLLLGAWSTDGGNFDWVISKETILFEIDMQEHPYQIRGDTLLIDRQDPTIGIQKTRVVRLTGDTLLIEDVMSGTAQALLRLR